jgi:hypothetical protein
MVYTNNGYSTLESYMMAAIVKLSSLTTWSGDSNVKIQASFENYRDA